MPNKEVTLQQTQEFFDFLQGTVPESIHLGRGEKLRLTRKQAFNVIWYLQERLGIIPSRYEMCHRRGCDSDLFDTYGEGCSALWCDDCASRYCPRDGRCDGCPKAE